MDLSIVVPLHNEVDNVPRLHSGIGEVLGETGMNYEVVFVDDGSNDGTLKALYEVAERDARIRVVKLRANYGQTAAMRSGIEQARGAVIVTMDGDLQNDPRDIPALVARIHEGYDLVAGWRRDRKDPFLSRNLPSKIANWIIRKVSGVPIHDTGCSLKAYRAELIRQLPLYSELHRFIPAMSTLLTSRFGEVVVRHHPRQFGKSKYGLSRIARVILDIVTVKMLISFSSRPMHWFGIWCIPCFGLAMLAGGASFVAAAGGDRSPFVFAVVALLFANLAVYLLLAGVIGELAVRSQSATQLEPLRQHIHGQSSPVE